MEQKSYKSIIEAILFTMGKSVDLEKIAAAIELENDETKRYIEELAEEYRENERGMQIMELDGAYSI